MDTTIEVDGLYKNVDHSDVKFILRNRAGHNVKFPAHRVVLSSHSPVFDRMFYGELKEGHTITITDVSAEGFAEFLQLFYKVNVNLSSVHIGDVLKLLKKYDANGFWPVCVAFMRETLTDSTAYEYYELSLSYQLPAKIKLKAKQILCKNRELVFDTSVEVKTNLSVVASILESDQLVGDEMDIFYDVMTWAEALLRLHDKPTTVENIAKALGNLLRLIRFPVMKNGELLGCLGQYPGLLPSAHVVDIMSYVVTGKALTTASQYNCKKRWSQCGGAGANCRRDNAKAGEGVSIK